MSDKAKLLELAKEKPGFSRSDAMKAITKTYFAERIGVPPEKIFCVSIMPCVAKKAEKDGHVFDWKKNQSRLIQDLTTYLTV